MSTVTLPPLTAMFFTALADTRSFSRYGSMTYFRAVSTWSWETSAIANLSGVGTSRGAHATPALTNCHCRRRRKRGNSRMISGSCGGLSSSKACPLCDQGVMSQNKRKILVTSALPYANGPIHLGHLVEYIQTDIWVRFQKLRGHECHYVCADDTHGTPVMLRAAQEGVTPEQLIERMHAEHARDFAEFGVAFDSYYSTHSPENRELAETIYIRLRDAGHIAKRVIQQAYDPVKQMFLPDRFIKGECPKCGAKDQYGDSCEVCGATYSPTELRNAVSALSGVPPVTKESEHYFFKLGDFEDQLRSYLFPDITDTRHVQSEVANKLDEWFAAGLKDWDISRDAPYFGFEIPDAPGKYFYVWLDAPIGYMASFKSLCVKNRLNFDDFWGKDSKAELYHFIGKDILYFHALFWPAMLENAGYRTPTSIFVHGFLTVNGEKRSKSRGTFITR